MGACRQAPHTRLALPSCVLPCVRVVQIADAMTANLEERQFFRIKTPATHAEVMTYLSAFAALESFIVLCVSGAGAGRALAQGLGCIGCCSGRGRG